MLFFYCFYCFTSNSVVLLFVCVYVLCIWCVYLYIGYSAKRETRKQPKNSNQFQ